MPRSPSWDHPRACGEKADHRDFRRRSAGSPPRMRGKALDRPPYVSTERITPAHAGKSATSRRSLRASGDHPRACGEKIDGDIRLVQMRGSPPRVRGKAIAPPTQQTRRRITPACAGKSKGMDARARQLQDHPRVCGEKSAAPAFSISVRGSPPRVRGKVRDADDPAPAKRITPACAGKSSRRRWAAVR